MKNWIKFESNVQFFNPTGSKDQLTFKSVQGSPTPLLVALKEFLQTLLICQGEAESVPSALFLPLLSYIRA